MGMNISEEQVKHVAKLAKLKFEKDELHKFAEEFTDIVEMVEKLKQVDTTDVPGTYSGIIIRNTLREDVAEEGTDREELFKNVKSKEDGFIKVPAMLDSGEGDV